MKVNKTEKEMFIEMHSDVKHIKKVLEGNGHEGIVSVVDKHEKQFNIIEGRNKFIMFAVGSGWVLFAVSFLK